MTFCRQQHVALLELLLRAMGTAGVRLDSTHFTQLNSFNSSHTTELTQLISLSVSHSTSLNSSDLTHLTQLPLNSSHSTHLNSSLSTHLTQVNSLNSSPSTQITQLISLSSSHSTHLTQLTPLHFHSTPGAEGLAVNQFTTYFKHTVLHYHTHLVLPSQCFR